jgi:hypothetical protein
MAYPTNVNSQITDAVTQSNLEVLGVSPAMATSNLYMAISQALANAAHNATAAQQQTWITAQAATAAGVAQIFASAAAAGGATAAPVSGTTGG